MQLVKLWALITFDITIADAKQRDSESERFNTLSAQASYRFTKHPKILK